MSATASWPVLIVGAGPTGLTLALTLARHGVPVRIVDRATQASTVSKALALWSGSLEAIHGMGVVDTFLSEGKRLTALQTGHGARALAAVTVGAGIDSPYPFPLLLPQSRTEAILSTRLAALGITVERGVELVGVRDGTAGVTATLQDASGTTETVGAPYLVGCDGARSTVRHALDIPFEGMTEPQTFLLGDVKIDGGGLDDTVIYVWWHNRSAVALFPFQHGVWRVFTPRLGPGGDAMPTVEELQGLVDAHGPPGLRLRDPSWLSAFKINERLALRYRRGRCFLAGDAAHIHSPAGGQGMNTGIQDAVNLGWKLGYVMNGRADPEMLLDSYHAERRPIARAVIDGATQKLHALLATGPVATALKIAALSTVGRLPALHRKLMRELSETDIVYHDGPLVALGAPPSAPRRTDVGARARDVTLVGASGEGTLWSFLTEPRHSLLVFAEAGQGPDIATVLADCGDSLAVKRIDAAADPSGEARRRYRVDGPGWVLIRPDQVVAARGSGADTATLERYLARVCRPSNRLHAA
jgi:2-polyprenyl-6-methoxyphenol hydroxylase-like FAD-dependent oxidoreductase